jgi:hypothetical protein
MRAATVTWCAIGPFTNVVASRCRGPLRNSSPKLERRHALAISLASIPAAAMIHAAQWRGFARVWAPWKCSSERYRRLNTHERHLREELGVSPQGLDASQTQRPAKVLGSSDK